MPRETDNVENSTTVRYTWFDTDRFTRSLAEKITKDNYMPELVVGILRGGCVPAVHISHLLRIRHFYSLYIQSTVTDTILAQRQRPIIVNHTELSNIRGKRVLLVDDVTNTGSTVKVAISFIEHYEPSSIKTAVLVWDTLPPSGLNSVQDTTVDYYIEKVRAWIVFPWND